MRRYRVSRACGRYGAAARIWAASGAADVSQVSGRLEHRDGHVAAVPHRTGSPRTGCLPLFTATVPTWPMQFGAVAAGLHGGPHQRPQRDQVRRAERGSSPFGLRVAPSGPGIERRHVPGAGGHLGRDHGHGERAHLDVALADRARRHRRDAAGVHMEPEKAGRRRLPTARRTRSRTRCRSGRARSAAATAW